MTISQVQNSATLGAGREDVLELTFSIFGKIFKDMTSLKMDIPMVSQNLMVV